MLLLQQDEREAGGRDANSTPLSNFADVESTATLTSVGSAVSMHVAAHEATTTTTGGPTQRDNNNNEEAEHAHALPPIKNSYNLLSMLSPKVHGGGSNFRNNSQRLHTPKVIRSSCFLLLSVISVSLSSPFALAVRSLNLSILFPPIVIVDDLCFCLFSLRACGSRSLSLSILFPVVVGDLFFFLFPLSACGFLCLSLCFSWLRKMTTPIQKQNSH
jgi:hypothetical protein